MAMSLCCSGLISNLQPGHDGQSRRVCRAAFASQSRQTAGGRRSRLMVWAAQQKDRRPATVAEQLGRTNAADASKRQKRDREDLYTDAWDGSEWKGSQFNVLNVILVVSVLVPLLGLAFAYFSFGKLWG